ncbi:MAG: tetratricopeptide repeat protein [Pyrinomonadaceae bacterium]|nr:tetratricopeptide repeat protein [Pyrinomonadaceae bacterium]
MTVVFLALIITWSNSFQQPSDLVAKFNHAVELQQQGALKEAAAEYRSLLTAHPSYAEAHANLGVVLAQLGQYEAASASYEAALRLAPRLTPILLNLGIAHFRAGRFDQAVTILERFLTHAPDHVQARQLLGLSLVELGRNDAAIAQLEKTIGVASDDPAVLYGLGISYLRQQYPGVNEIIERLAKLPTGLAASHLLRGQTLLGRFEFERAVAEFEAAAKLNPDLPRLPYSLGLAYLKLGRNKEAIAAFESELRRTPQDFSTLYYLAYLHEANEDLAASRSKLDAALKLESQSPEANALLGKILVKQGKATEALIPLEAATAKDPADPEKRFLLARVYQQLGRRMDAAREFAEVQRLKALQLKNDRARTPK